MGCEEILLDCEPALAEPLVAILSGYVPFSRSTLEDRTEATGVVHLEGPHAEGVLVAAGLAGPPAGPYAHLAAEVAGVAVRVVRSSRAGEEGFDLRLARGDRQPDPRPPRRHGRNPFRRRSSRPAASRRGSPAGARSWTRASCRTRRGSNGRRSRTRRGATSGRKRSRGSGPTGTSTVTSSRSSSPSGAVRPRRRGPRRRRGGRKGDERRRLRAPRPARRPRLREARARGARDDAPGRDPFGGDRGRRRRGPP